MYWTQRNEFHQTTQHSTVPYLNIRCQESGLNYILVSFYFNEGFNTMNSAMKTALGHQSLTNFEQHMTVFWNQQCNNKVAINFVNQTYSN